MPQITFIPENISVHAEQGENLLEVARKGHVFVDAECNGSGTCGKCKLKVVSGNVDTHPSHHLSKEEAVQGFILACMSDVNGDLTVESQDDKAAELENMKIEDFSDAEDIQKLHVMIAKAAKNDLYYNPGLKKDYLKLTLPTIDDNSSDLERIVHHLQIDLGYRDVHCGLTALKNMPVRLRKNNFQITVTHRPNQDNSTTIINIESGNTAGRLYGAAIDVGTTSVAAFLVDLLNGNIIAKASAANAQIRFGADVINRIIHAGRKGGMQDLQRAIIEETINPLLRKMCRETGVNKDEVGAFTAAGNTTMMHLMLGVYPDYLRREPYIPAFLRSIPIKANELDIAVNPETFIYILPSIASYVGGDITAGVLASGLWAEDQTILFMDLGTNGEIVFGNKDYMLTCACSAGPAFEGGGISCGMRASAGAIDTLTIDHHTLCPKIITIDDEKPKGISGSGIIDAVAEMFLAGIIDSRGRIKKDLQHERVRFDEFDIGEYVLAFRNEWEIEKDITITDIDLENFIRAKGALYSAVSTLMASIGMEFNAIDKIFVAGGIGNNIDINNAINIGLFPDLPMNKYEYIGNSSLMGSYLALISQDARSKVEEVASRMTYVELSVHPTYMNEFVSACFLPHTDLDRFPTVKTRKNNIAKEGDPMCESNAYFKRGADEEMIMENVAFMRVGQDDIYLTDLMGEEKKVKGKIEEIKLLDHKILIRENA